MQAGPWKEGLQSLSAVKIKLKWQGSIRDPNQSHARADIFNETVTEKPTDKAILLHQSHYLTGRLVKTESKSEV